jgi:hypothetical protein
MLTPPDIGPIRSIAYLKKTNMWIGMTAGRHQLPGDSQPVPGFYSLTSPDLIHWTNLQRVISLPMAPRKDSMTDIYSYPSLIDPESASKNFESLDHDKAILLFTDHHLRNGTGTLDRDLKYVIVDIRAN